MEKNKENTSVMVIDNSGLFLFVAIALTKYFPTVRYYNRWESSFPFIAPKMIGTGFDGVEKIDAIEDFENETDIFIFPDAYCAPIAERLRRDGHKVWGSGFMDYIERDRVEFMEEIKKAGLDVPKHEEIESFDKLITYLDDKEDLWIKISEFRGMTETFHWINKTYTKYFIECIKTKFGPFSDDEKLVAIVQDPIEGKLEYGTDMPLVIGEIPPMVTFGFEGKDKSWYGKLEKSSLIPEGLRTVNEKFEKITKKYKYTGWFSIEVREDKDGTNYFTDITPRAGYPPMASMFYLCDNWGEVISEGVKGNIVALKPRFKYVAELIVFSDYDGWNPIKYDEKYKENIFPAYCCVYDKVLTRVPDSQLYGSTNVICSVVEGADTLEEAIAKATEIAGTIQGIDISFDSNLAMKAKDINENLKKETSYIF